MDPSTTLADRLHSALRAREKSASDLARACGVSPAAVSKWLEGRTKKLEAENYIAAARFLGIREEWLRTGKVPRERDGGEVEQQAEEFMELLKQLHEPLVALTAAIAKAMSAGQRGSKGKTKPGS